MFSILQLSSFSFLPLPNSDASKLGSMAIRCPSLQIRIPGGDVKKSCTPKVWVLHNSHTPLNRKSTTHIQCISNKVFEDESKGIVCYEDANGEVICEGYDDEGPRFSQQNSRNLYYQRKFQIPDFFPPSLLQTTEGVEFQCIKVSVKDEGFDCMDVNGLC
ncbi:hypothetical protein AAC387_Pa09g2210 [Persea americana]